MKALLADCSASISELRKNPIGLLNKAGGKSIEISKYNKTVAYLVPAQLYELIMDQLDDYELAKIIESRRADLSQEIEVSIDDL
ncbi:type II toxin-antitoxin system Phd/YefM family antitoxin [Pseudoalteromonas sp. MMG007]|uniref:type II toxin-antitoxin system Phd/YefM family antitoxin n=1 Tax=Pseudoalteromonas sp. MMG007 TaxID=2822684 RepID=UPI001B358865|nr:type II toxin-antitoxin system Phd/YefM family antitoxin [Pseudoalteromonas sp. MMG007]MBQ4857922.1 type II toxin-antitoxin system Phd/YefM family antitoxin [Pseudoalteromonas sp. MMG007]